MNSNPNKIPSEFSKKYIGIVVFCIRDYTLWLRILSILMTFFKALDCTEESRKDETCLQFKMNKYFIKTRKIYQNEDMLQIVCVGQSVCWRIHPKWNTR